VLDEVDAFGWSADLRSPLWLRTSLETAVEAWGLYVEWSARWWSTTGGSVAPVDGSMTAAVDQMRLSLGDWLLAETPGGWLCLLVPRDSADGSLDLADLSLCPVVDLYSILPTRYLDRGESHRIRVVC
jgi:hypothetical protein